MQPSHPPIQSLKIILKNKADSDGSAKIKCAMSVFAAAMIGAMSAMGSVGLSVVGFAVGFAVVGDKVVGAIVVGFAVVGASVVGSCVVGMAVVGVNVVGDSVGLTVGLLVVGVNVGSGVSHCALNLITTNSSLIAKMS